jgi:hypothetical protein
MPQQVLIIDTSVLCCLLQIPGKDTCGGDGDEWNHARIVEFLHARNNSTRVLPLATIIETGNHVAQSGDRHRTANELGEIIASAANATSPWAAFADQAQLWEPSRLLALAESWPPLALGGTSIGDATIKDVAEYYAKAGFHVEIITGDAGLKSYEPEKPLTIPRRRG